MAVGVTSFLRYKIKYRVFYVFHHLVFLAYVITIMHTIDVVERKNGGRSQTFKWFSASILLYVCDRAAMFLNHRYFSVVNSASAIDTESKDRKLVILKVKKPDLFHFSPGQYVYLKVPGVDNLWHPFSIGSGPESKTVDFYIKVYDSKSTWSGRLFQMINQRQKDDREIAWHDDFGGGSSFFGDIKVEILGPYGTPLAANRSEYTRSLVIGTGTGFVPCMSALQEHTHQCLALDPTKYQQGLEKDKSLQKTLERRRSSVRNIMGKPTEQSMDKVYGHTTNDEYDGITRLAEIIFNANLARSRLSLHVLFLFAPAFGLLMLGFTISWNTAPFDLQKYSGMRTFLIAGTIAFQTIFLFSFVQTSIRSSMRTIHTYIDIIVFSLNIVADWYWFSKRLWGSFDFQALTFYSLLSLYMIMRLWSKGLTELDYNPVKDSNDRRSVTVIYEKFRFVWSSRSAEFIGQVYPDISGIWDEVVRVYGLAKAKDICDIRIHCTDPDDDACERLTETLASTSLFRQGAVRFGRPNIQDLIEINTSEALASPKNTASRTLLAFCGSFGLGKKVKELKVMNDIFLLMSGNMLHGMDVVIQAYGDSSSAVSSSKNESLVKTMHPFSRHSSVVHDDHSSDEIPNIASPRNVYDTASFKDKPDVIQDRNDDDDDVVSEFSSKTNRILTDAKSLGRERLQRLKLVSEAKV